jgi:hypothetical protein
VLTKLRIVMLLLIPVVGGAVAAFLIRSLIVPWTWLALMIGVAVSLVGLIKRGLVFEWLLDQTYFKHGVYAKGRRCHNRAPLSSLSGRRVEHVFCMTDLVLGLPVYASSGHGGMIWRRLKPEPSHLSGYAFQSFFAGQLSIAELVRASAAFPGIPPRLLRIPADPSIELVARLPRLAFLADGGIWNNLGSQVLREDNFIGSHATWENGVLRPFVGAPKNIPLLCVNGSAPLLPTQTRAFRIPGVALVKTLLQIMEVLNANTVLPRVEAMRRAFNRRAWSGERPDHHYPADLIADLRPIEETHQGYEFGTLAPEYIRKSDPSVKKWEREALDRIRLAREHATKEPKTDWLAFVLGAQPEPAGSFPVCGQANIDDWDAVVQTSTWKELMKNEGEGHLSAPTTLGRIEPKLARRLITRGYVNTFLISLFLAPLKADDLDQLAKLPDRLDHITKG